MISDPHKKSEHPKKVDPKKDSQKDMIPYSNLSTVG
jgi:hypothetical protein